MITQLYNAQQSGNPPYSWARTPVWLQQGYNIINHCLAVDAERAAAVQAVSRG